LIGDEAETTHVELSRIHINLEFKMGLGKVFYLKDCYSALILGDISFMFSLHFGLSLVSGQFVRLIPSEMSLQSLLDD